MREPVKFAAARPLAAAAIAAAAGRPTPASLLLKGRNCHAGVCADEGSRIDGGGAGSFPSDCPTVTLASF